MKLLKNALLLSFLLLTACRKTYNFNTTGKLVINFSNGIPGCYSIYTESSYSTNRTPLYESGGYRPADLTVKANGNSLSFDGLNYGNYILEACPYSSVLVVQVVAGETRTYPF